MTKAANGACRAWLDDVAAKWEGDGCLVYPFSTGSHGYGQFRGALAHSYICEKSHGPRPSKKHEAAHKCGLKTCVNPKHLRWATKAQNETDKLSHGKDNRGERHGMSKLTTQEAINIRAAVGRHKDIAAQYGISRSTVGDLKRGTRWKHIS